MKTISRSEELVVVPEELLNKGNPLTVVIYHKNASPESGQKVSVRFLPRENDCHVAEFNVSIGETDNSERRYFTQSAIDSFKDHSHCNQATMEIRVLDNSLLSPLHA